MSRLMIFLYGAGSYVAFLAVFVYAIGFIGDFGVPKSLDSMAQGPWLNALWVNLGLLTLFAVQHSGMARPAFKRFLTRFLPQAAERSTYVLLSSVALAILFWQWQPMGDTIWKVENYWGKVALYAGYAAGWVLVLVATFLINHFDLFGLRQVWMNLMGKTPKKLMFSTPLLYRMVRHPLYVGWLIVFWCTPNMTVSHLMFACVTAAYILVAIQLEERDLMDLHPEYAEYRKQVPMLVPGLPRHVPTLLQMEMAGHKSGTMPAVATGGMR